MTEKWSAESPAGATPPERCKALRRSKQKDSHSRADYQRCGRWLGHGGSRSVAGARSRRYGAKIGLPGGILRLGYYAAVGVVGQRACRR